MYLGPTNALLLFLKLLLCIDSRGNVIQVIEALHVHIINSIKSYQTGLLRESIPRFRNVHRTKNSI